MTDNAKTVDIKVIYKPNAKPNVELQSDDVTIIDGQTIIFSNNGHDGFWVRFVLDNDTLAGYRFVNSAMSPMYSAVATDVDPAPCPSAGEWDKFKTHDVDERTLTVRNRNVLPNGKHEERFGFALRVTKDPDGNGKVTTLDPGGVNQNGPKTRSQNAAVLLVAGIAIGAVAALGVQALIAG